MQGAARPAVKLVTRSRSATIEHVLSTKCLGIQNSMDANAHILKSATNLFKKRDTSDGCVLRRKTMGRCKRLQGDRNLTMRE